MEFKLIRQIFSLKLRQLVEKKLKQKRERVPRASLRHLREMPSISREIEKNGIPSNYILKKLPKKLGYGLFLSPDAKPIEKGSLIAPYSGQVLLVPTTADSDSDYIFGLVGGLKLTREEQAEFDPKNRYHPARSYSLDLDAERVGNFTRFINHSEKPNVEAEMFKIPKNRMGIEPSPCEILYIAKRKILPGEQLLVCYEGKDKTYWGPLKIKPFPMTPKTFLLNQALKLIS